MLGLDGGAVGTPPGWDAAGRMTALGNGVGATPGALPPGAAPADEPDGREAGASPRARVLIVEDEMIIAWLLAEHVENLGYEVCGSAADEDEAVRLARSTRPDLILMDVRLRGAGDGIKATEAIRATLPAVPVVFCTAYAGDPATRGRMAAAGAAAILAKPILPEQLGPLLGRLLGSA